MRVTNKQAAEIITRDLFRNHQLLLEAQIRVASQKRINKPSDDPIGMRKVLNYRKILSSIEQYSRNIDRGKIQIEVTETSLEEVHKLLQQVTEIALQQSEGDREDRPQMANQVKHIYEQILALANTKIGEGYVFAGHVTNIAPFSRNADGIDGTADDWIATYSGDNGDVNILVGDNVQVKVNVTGQDAFDVGGTGGGVDVFEVLHDLITDLEASPYDPPSVSSHVATLKGAIDQVENANTGCAICYSRLETAENHLLQYKKNIQDMLLETEGIDVSQAIVEMQLREAAYVTCLETASRIIQPSLVDFFK